jgi:excisionase family DNA binding protein
MKRKGKKFSEDGTADMREVVTMLRETHSAAEVEKLCRNIKIEEAAQQLGFAVQTVRSMASRRKLPIVKVGKRAVRFRPIDLILWSARRKQPARS